MKTKITRFIVITAFILSAVHCTVDSLNQTHFRPVCCDGSDSEEEDENQADENELIIPPPNPITIEAIAFNEPRPWVYTIEQMQQILPNLAGTYSGRLNHDPDRTLMIFIEPEIIPALDNNTPQQAVYVFSLEFLRPIFGNDYDYRYSLLLDDEPNATRVIGLRPHNDPDNSIVYRFQRSEINNDTDEVHDHDETN